MLTLGYKGLKNYDPQRDKRFSGTVRLPSVPRPGMAIWYDCDLIFAMPPFTSPVPKLTICLESAS